MKKRIAVIGGRAATGDQLNAAAEIGAAVAEKGYMLLTGGTEGVAQKAAEAAVENSGEHLAVIQGKEIPGNRPDITIPVIAGMREVSDSVLIRSADTVVVIGGSYGTLSEIAFALNLHKPVYGFQTWSLTHPDTGKACLEHMKSIQEIIQKL